MVDSDPQLFPSIATKDQLNNIKGKTLEVYYYLVEHKTELGVREIQRALDYASPSIASYHLNKLYEYNLIEKNDQGKYFIEGDPIKLGALKDHITIAGFLVPRTVVYGVQSAISIIVAIILLVIKADILFWFFYFVIINISVLIKVILDTKDLTEQLKNATN